MNKLEIELTPSLEYAEVYRSAAASRSTILSPQ
jgi:hypothetical protein